MKKQYKQFKENNIIISYYMLLQLATNQNYLENIYELIKRKHIYRSTGQNKV